MRILTSLVAVGIAAATTGCIEMTAPGFGNMPFANSGVGASPYAMSPFAASPYAASPYAASPYAASPYAMSPYAASPYYGAYPQPVANNYYTNYQPQPQVQYVPVQSATPQRSFSRWEGRRNGTFNNQQQTTRRVRDSDGDGIPDWKERREQRRTGRTNG